MTSVVVTVNASMDESQVEDFLNKVGIDVHRVLQKEWACGGASRISLLDHSEFGPVNVVIEPLMIPKTPPGEN